MDSWDISCPLVPQEIFHFTPERSLNEIDHRESAVRSGVKRDLNSLPRS